jgi:L-ascorbate metabolism protein UlaG (beta-lactamase superfamily)
MSRPEIFFRNHACIQVDYDNHTLICDPWFDGKVFNESWALLKPHSIDLSVIKQNFLARVVATPRINQHKLPTSAPVQRAN